MSKEIIEKIEICLNDKDFYGAIVNYNKLDEDDQTAEVKFLVSKAVAFMSEPEDAVDFIESIKDIYYENEIFCFRYALGKYFNKDFEEALALFKKGKEKGLSENPDNNRFSIDIWISSVEEKIKYETYVAERRAKRIKTPIETVEFSAEVMEKLWGNSDYSFENYTGKEVSDIDFLEIEKELGYRLPTSYKELIKKHNGGILESKVFKNDFKSDHIIDIFGAYAILGIDTAKSYSLCGEMGSEFWIEEWGYPEIGVAVCEGVSGGHDMFFLDYSDCGKDGEPCVVYIDQEDNYEISYIADNFQDFINGLTEDEY